MTLSTYSLLKVICTKQFTIISQFVYGSRENKRDWWSDGSKQVLKYSDGCKHGTHSLDKFSDGTSGFWKQVGWVGESD